MVAEPNLICTRLGIGASILIGYVASEIAGALTIVALPIAASVLFLASYCNSLAPSRPSTTSQSSAPRASRRRRDLIDALEYFGLWMGVLETMTAAATCARIASATIDYTSGGKFRDLLLGLESHSLGEPWPDVLGVTIVLVVTLLFMLGLERSTYFSVLLYCGICGSFLFFASVGGYYTNIRTEQWSQEFRTSNYQCIMSATGMCAFGFSTTLLPSHDRRRRSKLIALFLVPLLMYASIALVYTFMSHYREVSGTAIPLIRVFEVRDVGWARPIMAVATICVVCLALTEIVPALYDKLVILASNDWQILILPLLYRSTLTGAPVLAIFTAGSLTSILAFACPLAYLIPLLNASVLLKCSFNSTSHLYGLLKRDAASGEKTDCGRTRGRPRARRSPGYKLKAMMELLPRFMRASRLPGGADARSVSKSSKLRKETASDKEYLLLGDYNKVATSDSESEITSSPDLTEDDNEEEEEAAAAEEEESISSTDIDAVVQEYKDKVEVTTTATTIESKAHRRLNKFIVCSTLLLIHLATFILSFDIASKYTCFVWLNCAVLIICIATTAAITPRSPETAVSMRSKLLTVVSTTISIILDVFFATPLITIVWLGIGLWLLAGLLLFCRCNCCNCDGLFEKEYECMGVNVDVDAETSVLNDKRHIIDTIYIQR